MSNLILTALFSLSRIGKYCKRTTTLIKTSIDRFSRVERMMWPIPPTWVVHDTGEQFVPKFLVSVFSDINQLFSMTIGDRSNSNGNWTD